MASSSNNTSLDIFSPRKPEGTTSRKLNTMTTSTLGVGNFLKDLDKIQEQQIAYTKKLERYKRKKYELDEKLEVYSLFNCFF